MYTKDHQSWLYLQKYPNHVQEARQGPDIVTKAGTGIQMEKRAQQEGVTGEESIEQPAKGVHYTMGEAVEGSAQGDLEEKAGWDTSEGDMSVGQTAIEVMNFRGAQSTMKTQKVRYMDRVEVGDTTNDVIKDTGNTREVSPLPEGANGAVREARDQSTTWDGPSY